MYFIFDLFPLMKTCDIRAASSSIYRYTSLDHQRSLMKNQRPLFKRGLSIIIVCLIICSPSISLGWGAGGHMMTADIAYHRLNHKARAKVIELLAIEINPVEVTAKSKSFVSASHWPDDLRPFKEFDMFKPLH